MHPLRQSIVYHALYGHALLGAQCCAYSACLCAPPPLAPWLTLVPRHTHARHVCPQRLVGKLERELARQSAATAAAQRAARSATANAARAQARTRLVATQLAHEEAQRAEREREVEQLRAELASLRDGVRSGGALSYARQHFRFVPPPDDGGP
eukprot:COSAG01_NODE_958_length_12470_cov_52.097729_3_plen_153_part_00